MEKKIEKLKVYYITREIIQMSGISDFIIDTSYDGNCLEFYKSSNKRNKPQLPETYSHTNTTRHKTSKRRINMSNRNINKHQKC